LQIDRGNFVFRSLPFEPESVFAFLNRRKKARRHRETKIDIGIFSVFIYCFDAITLEFVDSERRAAIKINSWDRTHQSHAVLLLLRLRASRKKPLDIPPNFDFPHIRIKKRW
jgi:hypothetical protein